MLPALGTERRCCEKSQLSSLFLPGAYKALMYADVLDKYKKSIFLQREGMSFLLFSKKQPAMKSGAQERRVSHLEAFCTQL